MTLHCSTHQYLLVNEVPTAENITQLVQQMTQKFAISMVYNTLYNFRKATLFIESK